METNNLKYIKDRLDFKELVEEANLKIYVVSVSKFKTLCCFHSETTPSLTFYLDTGKYHCFGCGAHGDKINFYAQTHNLTNEEAIKELSNRLLGIGKERKTITERSYGDLGIASALIEVRKQITKEVYNLSPHDIYSALQSYCGELDQESREYLNSRGLNDETLKHFGIFSIKDYKKTKQFLLDNFDIKRLKQIKLISETRNKFLFIQQKIIIPLIEDGKIVALTGRYFYKGKSEVPEYSKAYIGKYSNTFGITNKLFNGDILKTLPKGETLYLCEGEFDAMAIHQHGKQAISLIGVALYSDETIERIKDFNLIIAFDNDTAGDLHARKVNYIYHKLSGKIATRLDYPEGIKDVTEIYLAREKN